MVGVARRVAAVVLAVVGIAAMMTLSPAEATTIKPGRPCATVGEKVVQGPWTFTCTLKKGKRVWVRQRTPAPTPSWLAVAQGLQASAAKRPKPSLANTFSFMISPTVPPAKADEIAASVRRAYEPWLAIAPIPDGFPVFILDERSKDWYLETSRQFPNDGCAIHWWNRMSPNPTGTGGAVCWGTGASWSYMGIMLGSRLPASDPTLEAGLYAHELVHVAQVSLLGVSGMSRMECWLGEGMAQVYSVALGHGDLSNPKNAREARFSRTAFLVPLIDMAAGTSASSPEYWLDVIRRSEDRNTGFCSQSGLGYSLGYLVTERLIEEFGEERFLQWLRATRVSGDSGASFSEVYGITRDVWYERSAAPYVAQQVPLIFAP